MEFYLFLLKTERSDSVTLDHLKLRVNYSAEPNGSVLAEKTRLLILEARRKSHGRQLIQSQKLLDDHPRLHPRALPGRGYRC